jgi:hypothetical protein
LGSGRDNAAGSLASKSVRSLSVCDDIIASERLVTINRPAKIEVTRPKTSAVELARATPCRPPPKAPLIPPPLPDCKSTTMMRKRHTITCKMLMNPIRCPLKV